MPSEDQVPPAALVVEVPPLPLLVEPALGAPGAQVGAQPFQPYQP